MAFEEGICLRRKCFDNAYETIVVGDMADKRFPTELLMQLAAVFVEEYWKLL